MKGVAQIRFIPGTNELIAADGYGNHRVSVWNADTLKFVRMWGAYGNARAMSRCRITMPIRRSSANPVHCAQPSNDGLIYVCDRTTIFAFRSSNTMGPM